MPPMAGTRDMDGGTGTDGRDGLGSGDAESGLVGGGPPCATCAGTGRQSRRLVHLTHGVSVWLCQEHPGDGFLRDDDGTVFAERLAAMWLATGTLTARRAAALRTHIRQIQSAGRRVSDRARTHGPPSDAKRSNASRQATTRSASSRNYGAVTRIVPRRHHRPARCDGGTHKHGGFCPQPPPQANPDGNDARCPAGSHSSRTR